MHALSINDDCSETRLSGVVLHKDSSKGTNNKHGERVRCLRGSGSLQAQIRVHGTVLDMAGLGRMAVGVDVDVAAGWGGDDPRTHGGLARTADTVCIANEAAEPPQTSTQEKIDILEKTLAAMGNEEPILAGRKLLE